MDLIPQAAEDTLLTHPHAALRLSELRELLAPHVDRGLTDARLREVLELHPERFRLLDAWQRRWPELSVDDEGRGGRSPRHGSRRVDAWVIALADTPSPLPDLPEVRLRESVRWLARGLDDRSVLCVGRWFAIAMSEREARRVMARRPPPETPYRGLERRAS